MLKETTNERTYRGFKVNSGNSKEHACFTKTLDQIVDTIEYMLSRHSKVISVRIDIDGNQSRLNELIPGMSVVATVDTSS